MSVMTRNGLCLVGGIVAFNGVFNLVDAYYSRASAREKNDMLCKGVRDTLLGISMVLLHPRFDGALYHIASRFFYSPSAASILFGWGIERLYQNNPDEGDNWLLGTTALTAGVASAILQVHQLV